MLNWKKILKKPLELGNTYTRQLFKKYSKCALKIRIVDSLMPSGLDFTKIVIVIAHVSHTTLLP